MNPQKLISVIVPVFNVENELKDCINSLLKQTYQNLEIILVEDGSNDKSKEICQSYADNEDKIRLFHHDKNQGLSAARNTGLREARGQYIMFVDSDDHIHYRACEILYAELIKTNSQIAVGDFIRVLNKNIIDADIQIKQSRLFSGSSKFSRLYDAMDRVRTIIACGKLYHKKTLENIRFPVGKLHEDGYVCHHILEKATKVVYVDVPLYYYYQRENSITKSMFTLKNTDLIPALVERIHFFEDRNMEEFVDMAVSDCLKNLLYYYAKLFSIGLRAEQREILHLFQRLFYTYRSKLQVSFRYKCQAFILFPWMHLFRIAIINKRKEIGGRREA